MKKIATLEFQNYPKLLQPVLDFVESMLSELDLDKSKVSKFRMACEEIVAQRMKNAYADEGTFFADIFVSKSRIEFSLRDMGEPYWIDNKMDYDPNDPNLAGLEDFLISNLVDESGMEKLGNNGQRYFIRIFNKLLQLPNPKKEEKTIEPPKDTNCRVKKILDNPDDLNAAICCLYHEYGYTYTYEELYYIERFQEVLESGGFHSYLIVNDHNEVAGHFGLAMNDALPNMPEACSLVIEQKFRELKLANRVVEHLIESSTELGSTSLMSQPTAFHTRTQHLCHKNGFTASGCLFQYIQSDVQSEYNKTGERLDLFITIKPLKDIKYTICCPKKIRDFTGKILDRMNIVTEYKDEEIITGESIAKLNINAISASAKIVVSRIGEDFLDTITSFKKSCLKNKVEMIELLLLMENGADTAYDILIENGFIFSGIMPGSDAGVYSVMQYLFGNEFSTKNIVAIDDYKEILEDIININNLK